MVIVSPVDNVAVALTDIEKGESLQVNGSFINVLERIPAKHKIALQSFEKDDTIYMYGVPVGEVVSPIPSGGKLSTSNVKHYLVTLRTIQ